MGYDTGLADRLRAQGLNVVEVAGWQSRGSASFNPRGFLWHHTAGPANGNSPSLTICTYGRAGLAGPLCNVFQARDNTVYVVAAGRANHAGEGSWQGLSGNSSVYGLEIENTGTGSEPWRLDQLTVAAKIAVACGVPIHLMCMHKEWTRRKVDMHTVLGDQMREISTVVAGGPAPQPQPDPGPGPAPEPAPDWNAIAAAIAQAKTQVLRRGDKGDAVKWAQGGINNVSGRGLTVDGDFGPATEQAVKDLEAWVHLPVDGVVGPEVWSILYPDAGATPPPPPPAPGISPEQFLHMVADMARAKGIQRPGLKGEGVKDLQRNLNDSFGAGLKVDGIYGPGTTSVVRNYQRHKGIGADGIAGFDTWVHLVIDAVGRLK